MSVDDAARLELERPWRQAGGVALPTLALSALILVAAVGTTTAAVEGALPLGVAIPLHVLWAYLAFTPAHEAGHGNVAGANRRLRWGESLVGWTMSTVLGLSYPTLRYLHLRHHSHTNDPEQDPDYRVSGSSALAVVVGCWTVQFGYIKTMTRLVREGTPGTREALRGLRIHTGLSLLFLAASVHFGFWTWVLLLWTLPAAIAQGLLALVFDWLPHHPHVSRERYRDTRVLPGALLEVLLLGQNYHLIHHLYPRLPFYRYSRCFDAVRPLLEANGATIGWEAR